MANEELPQIWYHKDISHSDAERLLLSNAGYDIGTFLVRRSVNKRCYCISFLCVDCFINFISHLFILSSVHRHYPSEVLKSKKERLSMVNVNIRSLKNNSNQYLN